MPLGATRGPAPVYKPNLGPVGGLRLARRLVFLLIFLWLIDAMVPKLTAGQNVDFGNLFRLPRGREFALLPEYVDYIKDGKAARPDQRIIVFLGSSPTYGHRIKAARNTYPYSFERALRDNPGNRTAQIASAKVYNLASDGQLLSDQYYIMKSLIGTADVFFVQLNYHTFNPDPLSETRIRYPEMPDVLRVQVSREEAGCLGRRASTAVDLNPLVQDFLARHWLFYRNRDRLFARLLGENPELLLYRQSQRLLRAHTPANARSARQRAEEGLLGDTGSKPFALLEPVQQMIILERYSELSRFAIRPGNSELFFLRQMVSLLKAKGKRAVFFMAPFNTQVVRDYKLIDPNQYRRNLAVVARPVKQARFPFIDYNRTGWLPSSAFFDIDHTLDSGGRLVGRRLFRNTAAYLGTPP